MNEIDWITLWLLNELVLGGSPLSRLVHHPDDDPSGYWAFPARAALRANTEARIEALATCVKQGWIGIYPNSWLEDQHFRPRPPITATDDKFHNARFLKENAAVLTFPGHDKWEADFQPDWGRFWSIEGTDLNETTYQWTLSVLYASNEILDELLRWFPSYHSLDRQVGLTELGCHTTFQHQATPWKVIPYAKVITWKAQDVVVELNKLIYNQEAGGLALEKLKHKEQVRGEEYHQAVRILCRLSKKWECIGRSPHDRFDAEPKVRAEY